MYIRNDKGITLIALIITIILMLILVSVGAYNGIESYKNAKVTNFVTQMQLIQEKVDQISYQEGIQLGTEVQANTSTSNLITSVISSENLQNTDPLDWRYFSKQDLSKTLNIDNIQDEIVINFQTREVVSINGVEYKGTIHHTQYTLPYGQMLVQKSENTNEISFDLETNIQGLNAVINITDIQHEGMQIKLKYKELSDEYSVLIGETSEATYQNYTDDTYDTWHQINGNSISIVQSGRYVIAATDYEQTKFYTREIIVILTNAPNLQEDMTKLDSQLNELQENNDWEYRYTDGEDATLENAAFAEKNNITYVWIPRFAYNEEDPQEKYIKFLKGNSNIPTDNEAIQINEDEWIIPEEFTDSTTGQEYRGIWFEIDVSDNLDLLEILSNYSMRDIIPVI